jgi:hypothetical protein
MISPTDLFNKYNGQKVGDGQCVAWYNVGINEQLGLTGYVIQGAYGAKDILTARNTRPDLIEQVWNNPNDMTQKPTPGDWIIWSGSLPGSGGYGHVAMCLSTPPKQIVSADQNWGGQTVHQVTHDWNYVIGWIHHRVPAPIVPPVDPTIALKAEIARLNAQIVAKDREIAELKAKNAELGKVIINQQAEIEKLKAQVGDSTKWQTLKTLIKELIS